MQSNKFVHTSTWDKRVKVKYKVNIILNKPSIKFLFFLKKEETLINNGFEWLFSSTNTLNDFKLINNDGKVDQREVIGLNRETNEYTFWTRS